MSHSSTSTPVAKELSDELSSLTAGERLRLLSDHWGDQLIASSSFGLQAGVMLHLISEHAPELPIVFIDTGYLFPETYQYMEALQSRFQVNLKVYQPRMTAARQEAVYGKLWEQGEEGSVKYGEINKVEPMSRALKELGRTIWISGVRRSHSQSRLSRPYAEQQSKTLKVYPILDWSDQKVQDYMKDKEIPQHPLASQGYQTMGDWHSTRPVEEGEDKESSRFGGSKYECGLHLNSGSGDYQI